MRNKFWKNPGIGLPHYNPNFAGACSGASRA
jgi:hypothetical protein